MAAPFQNFASPEPSLAPLPTTNTAATRPVRASSAAATSPVRAVATGDAGDTSSHETIEKLRAERDAALAEIDKLRNMIKQLQRAQFGARSEKLDPDQLHLGLEDKEQAAAAGAAAQEAATTAAAPAPRQPRAARRNRGALPQSLPREVVLLDVEDKSCSCCGGDLHQIGVDVSEQLDLVPAQFRVKEFHRPRYGCRTCTEGVHQAAAPARPIDGGMASEAVLAHVVISKYCDHLPLYRQAQMFARQGIDLDRSTLADWVGRTAWWVTPLYELLATTVLSSTKLFADDTPVPVLDPGRGRTKTGRLWAYARDDRPWAGELPPAVVYFYSEDRRGVHPAEHLAGFSGTLQVDGYAGFKALIANLHGNDDATANPVVLAFCWAHARRKFFEVFKAEQSPIAEDILARIAKLYEIEADIRGRPPDERRAERQARSKPHVLELHAVLTAQLARLSGKTALAAAIRYALNHWDGLIRFLEDGRLELDTNTVERTLRPIKLSAKNALFAGSNGGGRIWAMIASLIQTCKLNGVEPYAWLKDVLERIVSCRTKTTELESLLPWNWQPLQDVAAVG